MEGGGDGWRRSHLSGSENLAERRDLKGYVPSSQLTLVAMASVLAQGDVATVFVMRLIRMDRLEDQRQQRRLSTPGFAEWPTSLLCSDHFHVGCFFTEEIQFCQEPPPVLPRGRDWL